MIMIFYMFEGCLNFSLLVVFIHRKGSLGQFTVLCEKYQPSIERDPTYKEVFYVYIYYPLILSLFYQYKAEELTEQNTEGMGS